MVKIFGNAKKKWQADADAANTERNQQLTEATERLASYDNAEAMIVNEPDRYIRTLAVMHPHLYGKYVGMGGGGQGDGGAVDHVAAAKGAGKKDGPQLEELPGPDLKYQDGSFGYSPEQFQKRDEVMMRNAAKLAEHNLRKSVDPLLRTHRAQEMFNQYAPRIQRRVENMRQRYGDLFTEDEKAGEKSEVLTHMRKTGESLEAACAAILVPKMQKQAKDAEQRGREKALEEVNNRKKAAESGGGGPKKVVPKAGPKSTEDVVREAMRAANLV